MQLPENTKRVPPNPSLHSVLLLLSTFAFPSLRAQTPLTNPIPPIVGLLQQKEFTAAAEQATLALKSTPNDPRLWTLKGMALASADPHNPTPALSAFDQALKLSPDLLPALEAAAQLEYASGNPHARQHLQHILTLRPADPTANAMLAVLDFRANDFPDAATHFHLAEAVIASQPEALSQYAVSLANTNRLPEAIPAFQQALALQPANPVVTYNLALAEFRSSHPDAALTRLQPVLSSPNPDTASLTLAADILESQGKTQAGLDLLHRAILAHPQDPEPYIDLANLSFAHSSVQVGIDVLNAGLRELPNEPRLYLARGILSSQLGHNDAAMADFETANRLDAHLSFIGVAIGVAQSQQHASAQAISTFRKAAREHPDDALAHYLLAESLSEAGTATGSSEAQEQRSAALRAIQLDPKLVAARDLLTTIYLRENDIPHALEQSQAALSADPNDQQALFHLILAIRRSSNPELKGHLPDLVKRMAAARGSSETEAGQPRGFLLESHQ